MTLNGIITTETHYLSVDELHVNSTLKETSSFVKD